MKRGAAQPVATVADGRRPSTLIARRTALTALLAPSAVGTSLTEDWGEYDHWPAVYVWTMNGLGARLLDRVQTRRLYEKLLNLGPSLTVHGSFAVDHNGSREAETGFGWSQPGSRPENRHVVRPVRVSGVSLDQPLRLGLELHWSPETDDHDVLAFTGLVPNLATAELVLSCLWAGPLGRNAARAVIVYPDGGRREMQTVTRACDLVDRALMDVVARTRQPQTAAALPAVLEPTSEAEAGRPVHAR